MPWHRAKLSRNIRLPTDFRERRTTYGELEPVRVLHSMHVGARRPYFAASELWVAICFQVPFSRWNVSVLMTVLVYRWPLINASYVLR